MAIFGVINGRTERIIKALFAMPTLKLLILALIGALVFLSAVIWRRDTDMRRHQQLLECLVRYADQKDLAGVCLDTMNR